MDNVLSIVVGFLIVMGAIKFIKGLVKTLIILSVIGGVALKLLGFF